MFPRSPQERVGGVGSVLLFQCELPALKLGFLPPYSLSETRDASWKGCFILAVFSLQTLCESCKKSLTLPLFKNGILVHSPALLWKKSVARCSESSHCFIVIALFRKAKFYGDGFWRTNFSGVAYEWICMYIYILYIYIYLDKSVEVLLICSAY